jgi:hypothetical protein
MRFDCPFCQHEDAGVYRRGQETGDGAKIDIYICNECGLLYPRPRMEEFETAVYISKLHTNQEDFKFDGPTVAGKRTILQKLKKYLRPEGNALDIGTFTGDFCYTLKSFGFNAYGLEPQERASEFARENGLQVYTGSFPDNIPHDLLQMRYNLISAMETLYYFVDLRKGLNQVNAMLEDEKFLLIKCHQGKSIYYNDPKNSYFKRYGDHVQGIPTLNSLRYCLNKTGLEIMYIYGETSSNLHPVSLDKLYKGGKLKKVFNIFQAVLTRVYNSAILETETADRLIILAKKRGELKGV